MRQSLRRGLVSQSKERSSESKLRGLVSQSLRRGVVS